MGRHYTGKISEGIWHDKRKIRNKETNEIEVKTYVYSRATTYDRSIKKTVTLSRKLLGVLDEKTGEILPTRPKKKPSSRTEAPASEATNMGAKEAAAQEAKLVNAKRTRVGLVDILNHIGRTSGIKAALEAAFSKGDAQKIDTLAQFIVAGLGTLPNIESWQINHETPYPYPISEDNYHKLFNDIGQNEDGIQEFFAQRAKKLDKNSTIALDSTTFSTYSKKQNEACKGYNKAHDGLDTIKLLILESIKDKEPIAYTTQKGNVPDVKSLENALTQLKCFSIEKPIIVTDNGFFSNENILNYISNNIKFLTRANNSISWIKELIDKSKNDLEKLSSTSKLDNTVKCVSHTIIHEFVKTRRRSRNGIKAGEKTSSKHRLYVHIYFNEENKITDEQKLINSIFKIKESYIEYKDILTDEELEIGKKYLIESKSTRTGKIKIDFNDEAFAEAKKYFGIFVLISNSIKDSDFALENYRMRNAIESLFEIHKNKHDGAKPRVWEDIPLRGRLFTQFVALCYHNNLFNKICEMKNTLGKEDENKTKARINLEKKLKDFLKQRSFHQILMWFDCVEKTEVKTIRGKMRWTKETTKMDALFLELLGMKPSAPTAA